MVINSRLVSSFWDTCSSHNLISSRLAAELIAEGAQTSDVWVPMRQGVLYTGVMKKTVQAVIAIVHKGRIIKEEVEFFIWDMGADITLSNAYLEDQNLLPTMGDPDDDAILKQKFQSVQSGWDQRLPNARAELQSIVNHVAAEQYPEALQRLQQEQHGVGHGEEENSEQSFESRPKRQAGGCTLASHDSWTLQRAMKLREELQRQLKSPDPVVSRRLEELCDKYPQAFGTDITKPCLLKKFKIRLKSGAQYVALCPRRVSQPVLEEMQRQISEMLEMGVIEPSDSPWSAPVVMVRRPGSTKLRLAIDYRLINSMTEPAPFAMPDMHEVLDNLVGKKYYWSVDISSYYWQIAIDDESKPLTAFVVPGGGKFQFKRVPFGLRAAPMWAQGQLKQELDADPSTTGLVNFIDDISFGSNDPEELCQKFEALLKFAINHNIKLKREKCCLGVPALHALGCVVNSQGKWIDPDRVMSLLRIQPASTLKELKQLLGSMNFVRQWLAHAATTCAPLTDLLKKNARFEWGPEQDAALEKLKAEVQCSECLANIQPGLPVYLRPDASNLGCAAVLFQMIEVLENGIKVQRPRAIAYASRRFSSAERKWSTAEAEAFAIKWAMQTFQPLIQCLPVIIESDHANHRFLYSSQTSAKIQRWRMYLEQFEYEIRHIAGTNQEVADGLSRLHLRNLTMTAPTNEQAALERTRGIICSSTFLAGVERNSTPAGDPEDLDDEGEPEEGDGEGGLDKNFFEALSRSEIPLAPTTARFQHVSATQYDGWGMEVEVDQPAKERAKEVVWEEEEWTKEARPHLRASRHWQEERRCAANYGVGYKLFNRMGWRAEAELKLIEQKMKTDRAGIGFLNLNVGEEGPLSWQEHLEQAITQVHNDRVGHVGKLRTYQRLRHLPRYPWGMPTKKLQDKVADWVQGCMTCQKIWSIRGQPQGASGAVIRQRPFTEVSMDIVRITTKDKDENQYILNILDSFSRFSELFPLKTSDAESVAECLFAVYNRYGRPIQIRADGAKAFHKAVIKSLNRWLNVENHCTLAYSPFQNGQNERRNQEISRHLRAMVVGDSAGVNSVKRWGLLVSSVQRILNNTVNSDTGCTPNELVFGGYGDTERMMFTEDPAIREGESEGASGYARELEEAQFEMLRRSELHQEEVLQAVARRAEREGTRLIQEGDMVLARRGGLGNRPKDKLQTRYTGPYVVLERPDPSHSIVNIAHIATKKVEARHMNELVSVNMSHFREVQEAIPYALQDEWTYQVDRILEHRPAGPRRANGRLRPKHRYEFLTLYKHIPQSQEEGDENPAWQPWSHVRHLHALRTYCNQPEVASQLGNDFYVSEQESDDST